MKTQDQKEKEEYYKGWMTEKLRADKLQLENIRQQMEINKLRDELDGCKEMQMYEHELKGCSGNAGPFTESLMKRVN